MGCLERLACFFQFAGLTAYEPGHPVHGAKLVEHGPTDAGHTVSFEFDAAIEIESVNRIQQTKDSGANQIIEVDSFGQNATRCARRCI